MVLQLNSDIENLIEWAGILIIKNRKVLTLKEFSKDFYQLPGGKVELDETPSQTVMRELQEELAVSASKLSPFTEVKEKAKNSDHTMHFMLYRGHIGKLPDRSELPAKTEDIAWIDSNYIHQISDIGNFLKHHVIPMLKQKKLIN